MAEDREHILVIRLGALGDLIFCFQAFHEIRRAHPNAEIALLTRAPFAEFARSLPWFDRVIVETHPGFLQWNIWLRLVKQIRKFAPSRIYDLQGKTRQSILYFLLGRPEWSGAAPRCKFPRAQPTGTMHFTDFLAAQLRVAEVPATSKPDMNWLDAPVGDFDLPQRFIVFIPGCSPNALHKRWPPEKYAEIANQLEAQNIACVAIGTYADAEAVAVIKQTAPNVVNLCGKTNLFELAGILRHASLVIGNDTGPIHMAAIIGMPTIALFCGRSSPTWSKPPGDKVTVLQTQDLTQLSVGLVSAVVSDQLEKYA